MYIRSVLLKQLNTVILCFIEQRWIQIVMLNFRSIAVSIISCGPVLKVHIAWGRHKLSIKPFLHHSCFQSFFLCEERVFLLGRRGHVAMHPSAGKWSQVVEEVLQLVHLGGGKDALESYRSIAAALWAIGR